MIASLLAQVPTPKSLAPYQDCPGGDPNKCTMTLQGLEGVFQNIVTVVVGLGTIALLMMLLMGGLSYITSGGDPQKAAAAKSTISHAIIGMVLIASAVLIITIIEGVTGANLSVFRIVCNFNGSRCQ